VFFFEELQPIVSQIKYIFFYKTKFITLIYNI